MRWEDERFVRVYTRDTLDWLSLSFEAQGLLMALLRKSDRAGLIRLGKHGKRGVAAAIGHAHRWETIAPALEEILADGAIAIHGEDLVFRNFIEAQEADQSANARQRTKRERDRDKALANVTPSSHEEPSRQDVTLGCHAEPSHQEVTPSVLPSVCPLKTTLSAKADGPVFEVVPVPAEEPTVEPPQALEAKAAKPNASKSSKGSKAKAEPSPAAVGVYEHWKRRFGFNGHTVFDPKRIRAVEGSLKHYSPEQLCQAVDGCAVTPHNMGANDKGEKYIDLELICRDATHVERFIANAQAPPKPPASKGRATEADKDWSNVEVKSHDTGLGYEQVEF